MLLIFSTDLYKVHYYAPNYCLYITYIIKNILSLNFKNLKYFRDPGRTGVLVRGWVWESFEGTVEATSGTRRQAQ